MSVVGQVGGFKKQQGIQPLAESRWQDVLSSKMAMAEALNINPDSIKSLYNLIHEEALRLKLILHD